MTSDPPSRALRWRPGVLAWALWTLTMLGIPAVVWFQHLLRQTGWPGLSEWGADDSVYVLAAVSAGTVGAVVASRRPRHAVGWLMLALGLSAMASGVCEAYASYGVLARPGALPAARWAAVYYDASWVAFTAFVSFILLLTPTGSLPSPRWRWWAGIAVIAPLAAGILEAGTLEGPFASVPPPIATRAPPFQLIGFLSFVITILALLVAAASLAIRFRHARGIERQQLRWVTFAAVLAAVAAAAILVGWAVAAEAVWDWATGAYLIVLPLAVGAAVLRYRLYDIDRIISRVLAYGLLTVLLGFGYAGIVLVLGQLLGRSSSVTVAGATLVVAGAFQPARRRIQAVVDRRFNRRQYDAARTVQAFSVRLRDEIDLGTLTGELLTVVDQAIQPGHASLWLRRGE